MLVVAATLAAVALALAASASAATEAEIRHATRSLSPIPRTPSDHGRRLSRETNVDNERFLNDTLREHLPRLQASPDVSVLGPSVYPKPNRMAVRKYSADDGTDIVPYLEPTHGTHRSDRDAVFLFAAEYALGTYVLFIESLRDTGYQGDIVVAVSKMDYTNPSVRRYLDHDERIVVYVMEYTCFNAENEPVESSKGGIRTCQCHDLYARKSTDGTLRPLPDARPPRTVPTTRYEIYWIWSLRYAPHSWIMLIDARDTVFQRNPFDFVERHPSVSGTATQHNNSIGGSASITSHGNGLLYFFAENQDATRIGLSKANRKWLTNAYGAVVADRLKDKPTICSGSTMGEQIAVNTYLRAMVSESDETGTRLMGADQGFHNYLYYSNKLANARSVRSIAVQDQGFGIINNLGAMRTQPLDQWGNGRLVRTGDADDGGKIEVLNWDGSVSPVVHQFDRHELLSKYFYGTRTRQCMDRWKERAAAAA